LIFLQNHVLLLSSTVVAALQALLCSTVGQLDTNAPLPAAAGARHLVFTSHIQLSNPTTSKSCCSPHCDLLLANRPGFFTVPAGHGTAAAAATVASSLRPPLQELFA
jgi:hypothetical protein